MELTGRPEARQRDSSFQPNGRAELVRHDELDLHSGTKPESMEMRTELARQMGDIFLHGLSQLDRNGR